MRRTYGHTKSGKPIDDDLIEKLADEAEAGYDVDEDHRPPVASGAGDGPSHD